MLCRLSGRGNDPEGSAGEYRSVFVPVDRYAFRTEDEEIVYSDKKVKN